MSLTIGQVSGIIAAAVAVIQILFPNALLLILVGILGNEHNAVTWSVVQRSLLSSYWPSILQTDAATGRSVNIGVRLLALLSKLGLLLIALAAIVTPLGLYEAIAVTDSNVSVPFTDLRDTSPMGIGTPARSNSPFTRSCGNFGPLVCPGSNTEINYTLDPDDNTTATDFEIVGTYDALVPQSLIELYQSGLKDLPETVSSFFDIQTRQWTKITDPKKQDGKPFLVDAFRMLEPLLLNDAIEAKEGLVVDTQQGRIGFRHHRTPNRVGQGADWSEDLLFLEPVTECVNLNVTIEFKIPMDGTLGSSQDVNLTLIDNGGFADMIQEYPTMNVTTSQEDPQLRFRAYKAGWLVNVYSMLLMNVTRPGPNAFAYLNSERGKRFQIDDGYASSLGSASSVRVDTLYSGIVRPESNAKSNFTSTITNTTTEQGIYDNPFNITGGNYSDISLLCHGAGGRDLANSSNIFVQCGLVLGAARRTDGEQTLIFEGGDVYQRPIYSCASTTRASIKTVSFKFNATEGDSLKALTIQNITDKTYSENDGPNPPPLWAIETPDFYLSEIQQLWGLIDEAHKDAVNITAIRAPHLHLPGYRYVLKLLVSVHPEDLWYSGGRLQADPFPLAPIFGTPANKFNTMLDGPSVGIPGYQFIPGATATTEALAGMYGSFSSSMSGAYDYTGSSNLALFQKWQALSMNETGVARMLNIVWADLAANSMTGTRGWGTGEVTNAGANLADALAKRQSSSSGGGGSGQSVMVPVRLYEKKIRYRWVYGIPAFMALAMFLTIMAGSCCCMVFRRGTPKRTRYFLNHLSAGRLLAEQRFPGAVDKQVETKTWVKLAGKRSVALNDGAVGPGAYAEGYGSPAVGGAAVVGTPGGSPYVGAGGGFYEGKPGMGASATELSRLNLADRGGNGYVRVQG